MNEIILNIPTVNDDYEDFKNLFNIWNKVNNIDLKEFVVVFDFTKCKFLRQNAVAFLGGIIRFIQHRGGNVSFRMSTFRKKVHNNLIKNGFLNTLGIDSSSEPGNSVPYREDKISDPDNIINYLNNMWLGNNWIHISDKLKDYIVGKVWEIYANAFEHSNSPIGIFSCGQHYPTKQELKLTVIDFGVGIPNKVKDHFKYFTLKNSKCLEWAFKSGTSTNNQQNRGSRGLGLDFLKKFVKINNGKLEMFSGGYVLIDKNNEKFLEPNFSFSGTIVNISLICNESYYKLSSEGINNSF